VPRCARCLGRQIYRAELAEQLAFGDAEGKVPHELLSARESQVLICSPRKEPQGDRERPPPQPKTRARTRRRVMQKLKSRATPSSSATRSRTSCQVVPQGPAGPARRKPYTGSAISHAQYGARRFFCRRSSNMMLRISCRGETDERRTQHPPDSHVDSGRRRLPTAALSVVEWLKCRFRLRRPRVETGEERSSMPWPSAPMSSSWTSTCPA